MQGKIQRKIEWRYPGDWPDRETADNAEAPLRRRQQIEWNDIPFDPFCFFRGDFDSENPPVGFDLGVANRLGGFQADGASNFIAMLAHFGGQLREYGYPFERCHGLELGKNTFSGDDRRFKLIACR